MPRVLHVLSQRPSRTGSGVTLDSLVRQAQRAGWRQRVVVGVPATEPSPRVGELPGEAVEPLTFEGGRIEFPVPGMSDVMPYTSARFSELSLGQLEQYRAGWREHLHRVVRDFRPDLIHSHHVWLLSAMIKDVAPALPVVTHCHATGLRQMELCPHLADEVRRGCARNDRFVVLHAEHAARLAQELSISRERIAVVGAGYREDLFHARGRDTGTIPRLVYVGKYSAAKGLPWLLDAFERVSAQANVELHVVGSGSGPEADALAERMRSLAPRVVLHGVLPQSELAELLRSCRVCVLPSFYEGLPLVLVEALACGCRLVATALPGIRSELAPHLGPALTMIAPPRLHDVDRPAPEDLPRFVDALTVALGDALADDAPPMEDDVSGALRHFTWAAVFRRVELVWNRIRSNR